MMEPAYGLKMWSTNEKVLPAAIALVRSGTFQYIELTPIPGTDLGPFERADVPFVVHAPSDRGGLNIADLAARARNERALRECLDCADRLGAGHVVIHPGQGRLEDALGLLEGFDDRRLLIENMPKVALWGDELLGHEPAQLRALMGRRFGLCLDLNHAIKASTSLGVPYREFLPRLLELGPSMFHVSDGLAATEADEHRAIGEGDYDWAFLAALIRSSAARKLTLETGRRDLSSFGEDLENLARLRALLEHGQ